MANIMIIEYLYMNEQKKDEWIEKINSTDVDVNWLKSKSRIEIRWYWNQKNKVEELIQMLREIFSEVTIKIKNGTNTQLPTQEDGEITNLICEPENPNETDNATNISDVHAEEKKIPLEIKAECKEIKINIISEVTPEEKMVTEIPLAKSAAPPLKEENESISKEECEKALKDFLGSEIEGYDFTLKTAEGEAIRFCINHDIKSEALKYALTLVGTAPNEAVFINSLSRFLNKNKALAKVELVKSFEKWMNNTYPSFIEKYPEVNVFHFLNIFREENNKF